LRSRIINLCLGVSLSFFLGGCAVVGSALNPYEDNFKCTKNAPFGTCESTMEVYADLIASDSKPFSPVAPERSDVPPGYEIVAAPESLPLYSAGSEGASAVSGDRYKVAKKPEPVKEVQIVLPVDGDNVVYPETARKEEKRAAPTQPSPAYTVRPKPETAYRDASLAKAAKLLKEPVTPIVIPPLVMRILIAPRKGEDGELNMAQFTYVMVDKPRWAMGDYLTEMPED